jgi:hypothetical protein
VLAANKRNKELSLGAIKRGGCVRYSYYSIRDIFVVNSAVSLLHLIIKNKMRFTTVDSLLQFLFLWEDRQERIE